MMRSLVTRLSHMSNLILYLTYSKCNDGFLIFIRYLQENKLTALPNGLFKDLSKLEVL